MVKPKHLFERKGNSRLVTFITSVAPIAETKSLSEELRLSIWYLKTIRRICSTTTKMQYPRSHDREETTITWRYQCKADEVCHPSPWSSWYL